MTVLDPRPTCSRCGRPAVVCYCAHLPTLETRTRVVFLQHPRERDMPIGTAKMASLCLPHSELHVGVHWSGTRALTSLHADPLRPPALLYPGEGAIDVLASPPPQPITLVVVDGTWAQTKKLVRENPELARLPRYAFSATTPSAYRIRREPDERYLSTIESLALVLGALEGEPERFAALLQPFHAMVEAQVAFEERFHAGRVRKPRQRERRGVPLPEPLRGPLVLAQAEANAWSYESGRRSKDHPDELVHLVAARLDARGHVEARFDVRVRPPMLAPATARHLALDEAAWTSSDAIDAPHAMDRWSDFIGDALPVAWGTFTPHLLREAGDGSRPWLDARRVARVLENRSVGTLEDYAVSLEASPAPLASGRAGARLGALHALLERWRAR